MGNHGSRHTGRVVLPDGSIRCFEEPLTAAELMLEHPQQVVAELTTNKLTPLPADKKLELHKLYLMLPLKRGKPPSVSSKDAHHILLRVNAIMGMQPTSFHRNNHYKFLPFFAKICPANTVEKSHRVMVARTKEVEAPKKEEEGEELDVGGDYHMRRCVSGKGWKPSLDTIEERKEDKKELSLLVVAGKVGRRIETKGLVWG